MKLIVAIHDVTPAHAAPVETLWGLCVSRGIVPALFVVPSWHGEFMLESDARFCGWLRRCASQGAEIFVHGERHDEVGAERGVWDALRAAGRTDREGEFLTLTHIAARNRIARGLRRLRSVGLEPVGFVAPAWLASRGARAAIGDVGLHVSEDASHVHLLRRDERLKSPVIRWSARTLLRAHVSVAMAAAARSLLREPLVRIALHPQDMRSAPVRHSVLRTLDTYALRALPTRYCAL